MAVILPELAGNIIPEYAATSINFNRQVQNVSGVLVAVFTAQLAYERKDYLVNEVGQKIGVVSMDTPMMPPPMPPSPTPDERRGNIYLTQEQTAVLFAETPATGKVIGEAIADMADALIHDDLVARGILEA